MSSAKLPLAVTTMVFDESDCLQIWLRYWRRHLPEAHLHVIIDGPNPELEAMATGCQVTVRDRPAPHEQMEEERWVMLSAFTADLLERYEVVVYTDIDEIIVCDPKTGISVVEALCAGDLPVRHTRGLELIHRHDLEPEALDLTRLILRQRQYVQAAAWYSKPCILRRPVYWTRGGHMTDYDALHFSPGLYTIHLRYMDIDLFLDRAERRRKTTKAEADLNQRPARKWRESGAGAQQMVAGLGDLPVMPGRLPWPTRTYRRMQRTFRLHPDHSRFYTYKTHTSRVLRRLPVRFLDLF